MTGRPKPLIINILLLTATVALLLVFSEVALRLWVYFEDRKVFSEAMKRAVYVPKGVVLLQHIIRPSRNNRIIYELKPDISVLYPIEQAQVTTNTKGFRDREYPMGKSPNTVRIIGLGDSIMFGQGVSNGSEYLSFMEEMLNALLPGKKWEVINTAVPGYNTVMEVETLKEKAVKYSPDIVIIGFCSNDMALPNFIRKKEESYIALRKSFLMEFMAKRLSMAKMVSDTGLYDTAGALGGWLEDNPEKVPDIYKDMVGWDAYKKAMTELGKLAKSRGFSVITLIFLDAGDGPDPVSDKAAVLSKELGFHVLDLRPVFREHKNRISSWAGSALSVSPSDAHPSPIAHKIAAENLIEYMYMQGIISKYGK